MGAQLRVVQRRIRSVQSTKKITRAMELIASSRIVKAQQRVEAARPYAEQLTKAMEDVARQTGVDLPTPCSRSARTPCGPACWCSPRTGVWPAPTTPT